MATVFRRQKGFDTRFTREPKHARIEDRFVLDHDNVRIVVAARCYGRHQRQRILGDIAENEPSKLSPGKWVEQRGDEGREKTPPLSRHAPERSRSAAGPG